MKKIYMMLSVFIPVLYIGAAHADPLQIDVLSAVIKDKHIPDATVIIQKNGSQSVSKKTDGNGKVDLNTNFSDTDESLVIIRKNGYSDLVAKCPCAGMTYAISPVMANLDGLRIVLNWGAQPADLDAHLAFRDRHIYFKQKLGFVSEDGVDYSTKIAAEKEAGLDVDNTKGFGPETITIYKKQMNDAYVYSVHDYTDRFTPTSDALSHSGVKALVYIGQSLVRTYYVPQGAGNLWTVFRITPEGEFQDINTMTGVSVDGKDAMETAKTYLNVSTQVKERSIAVVDVNNAKEFNKQGENAYHSGSLDQAIDYYRKAIEINPNFGQAYSNLGLAYQKANRMAEAIWADRKAIALAAGSSAKTVRASSYYNIGKIYESAGELDEALAQYQLAAQEKPGSSYDSAIERIKTKKQAGAAN